jgi:hypothetical protein
MEIFTFKASNLQDGNIPALYDFYKQLHPKQKANPKDDDDDDTELEATPEEILELTQLALDLLESGRSVENAKLNWLTAMLEVHP